MAGSHGKPPLHKPPGFKFSGVPGSRPPPAGPKAAIPPAFQQKKSSGSSCCLICCCFFCCFFLIIIVVFLVAGGLFYLVYEPKLPIFHLESFKLVQFNVIAKPDGTYLNAETTSHMELKNPNSKVQFIYGKTRVTISVLSRGGGDATELGTKEIEKFKLGKMNITNLKVETAVNNQAVNDGLGTKLKNEYENGNLKVEVEAKTSLGLMVQSWKIGPLVIYINCGGVMLKRLESGVMPKCSIKTLNWINIK